MPKPVSYILRWKASHEYYEWHSREDAISRPLQEDWWFAWLADHSSFSFQGKHGHLSLLKEARARGTGYWYAYRSLSLHTVKKYAGRSVDLTPTHLEELAHTLASAAPVERSVLNIPSLPSKTVPEQQTPSFHVPPATAPFLHPVPLLGFKLQPPRLHPSLIGRERLLARLDAASFLPVTLLSAAAGFGKTTLVSQWLSARNTTLFPLAWVTLDQADNDLLRFWRYIIAACQRLQAQCGRTALEQLAVSLRPPFNPPTMEPILTLFLNDLAKLPGKSLLVLDDYHAIGEPAIHDSMTFLLEHLPTSLHVLLLSRNTPALPLTRLRVKGTLTELQATDLRFTLAETRDFLQNILTLSPNSEQLSQLDSHLQGWPAGLRLLTLALPNHQKQRDMIDHLVSISGSHQLIVDYFVTEVLSSQSEASQDFLLRTSVLQQLNGDLCDFVINRQNSTHRLAELEQAGLFLEGVDTQGGWFRYHPLFAQAIRTEAMRRLGKDTISALSVQASIWFEAQGYLAEAIKASLQAQDMQRAFLLIGQLLGAQPLSELEDVPTLLLWLQQIPLSLLKSSPLLCQSYATALLFSGKVANAEFVQLEMLLQLAEEGWQVIGNTPKLGEIQMLGAMLASRRGAHQRARALARESLLHLPVDEQAWRNIGSGIVGIGALQEGQISEAYAILYPLCAYWEAIGNIDAMRGITLLIGNISYEQAALHRAKERYRQVLALAQERGDKHDTAHALRGLAAIAYEQNELVEAEHQAREGFSLGKQINNTQLQVESSLLLARIEHARGQHEAGLQRCASLCDLLQKEVLSSDLLLSVQLTRKVQAEQARFQLSIGDQTSTQRWAKNRDLHSQQISCFQVEQEELILARLLLAQGKTEAAQKRLIKLQADASEGGRWLRIRELQLIQAMAFMRSRQMQHARQHLLQVLAQTHPEGFLRLFLDEGEMVATLLSTLIPQIHEQRLLAYALTLTRTFMQEPTKSVSSLAPSSRHLIEPLSPQERQVLRLLVAGCSNREIAMERVVSINTIRTQVQSIYRKLGVTNRVRACEMARQLHLL
jgi:LuxR family maltose regulon positive regulatory protein